MPRSRAKALVTRFCRSPWYTCHSVILRLSGCRWAQGIPERFDSLTVPPWHIARVFNSVFIYRRMTHERFSEPLHGGVECRSHPTPRITSTVGLSLGGRLSSYRLSSPIPFRPATCGSLWTVETAHDRDSHPACARRHISSAHRPKVEFLLTTVSVRLARRSCPRESC